MPSLDITLCWALPVKVEILGAHLEAHFDLLPAIGVLRELWQSDTEAPITKLPAELLERIADILTTDARAERQAAWDTDFTCFQLKCIPIHHLTEEQITPWRERVRKGEAPEYKPSPPASGEGWDEDDLVDLALGDDLDAWAEVHYDRQHSWQDRVGVKSADRRGFFTDKAELISKHFGLEIWISHVRTRDREDIPYWTEEDIFPAESTVAYLKLPGAREEFENWDLTKNEVEEKDFMVGSGYGMPVALPKRTSQPQRDLFNIMLKTLDLKPWVHMSQMCLALSTDGRSEKHEARAGSSWPRLMALTRCITRSDEQP